MKNTKERLIQYLNTSSRHFFCSDDMSTWQKIVKHGDDFYYVKSDKVTKIDVERQANLKSWDGKYTYPNPIQMFKQTVHPPHPCYTEHDKETGAVTPVYYYGHLKSKHMLSSKFTKKRRELVENKLNEFLESLKPKQEV